MRRCPNYAEGYKVTRDTAVRWSSHRHRCGAVAGKRVCSKGGRRADGRDVVVRPAVFNVKLQMGTDADQVLVGQSHPVPQRTADAKKGIAGDASPPANLLGRTLAEAHLVALIPTVLVGIAGVLFVDARIEFEFLQRHSSILPSRQEKGNLGFPAFNQTRQDFAAAHRPLTERIGCAFPIAPVGPHPDLAALQVA